MNSLSTTYETGLSQYMTGIYTFMAAGLALTGGIAYLVSSIPTLFLALNTGIMAYVTIFSPLVLILAMSFGLERMSDSTLRTLFFVYSALMGASLSSIFITFTGVSIFSTFLVTTASFAGLSIYGMTTKKSLSGLGSFLLMGLIGLLVAMVVNIFLASSALAFAINLIGVLIFAALTAYDTQNLKELYLSGGATTKLSIMGALNLYLNFINLFMFLLQFMGNRQE